MRRPRLKKRMQDGDIPKFEEVAFGGGGQVAVEPSMTKFAVFAVFSAVVSIIVVVYLAMLVIRSNM